MTTGAGLTQTYEQRLGTALLNPEMCSLNMGFVLFFTPDGRALMLDNPEGRSNGLPRRCSIAASSPSWEVYNPTMLEEVERLIAGGADLAGQHRAGTRRPWPRRCCRHVAEPGPCRRRIPERATST